jgi:hypothetical protein
MSKATVFYNVNEMVAISREVAAGSQKFRYAEVDHRATVEKTILPLMETFMDKTMGECQYFGTEPLTSFKNFLGFARAYNREKKSEQQAKFECELVPGVKDALLVEKEVCGALGLNLLQKVVTDEHATHFAILGCNEKLLPFVEQALLIRENLQIHLFGRRVDFSSELFKKLLADFPSAVHAHHAEDTPHVFSVRCVFKRGKSKPSINDRDAVVIPLDTFCDGIGPKSESENDDDVDDDHDDHDDDEGIDLADDRAFARCCKVAAIPLDRQLAYMQRKEKKHYPKHAPLTHAFLSNCAQIISKSLSFPMTTFDASVTDAMGGMRYCVGVIPVQTCPAHVKASLRTSVFPEISPLAPIPLAKFYDGQNEDAFTTVTRTPARKPAQCFSRQCTFGRKCNKGLKCQFFHPKEERAFFQSRQSHGL